MASFLVRSSPDPAVSARALAVEIVLCSWARYFTPTVPLCATTERNAGCNPALN